MRIKYLLILSIKRITSIQHLAIITYTLGTKPGQVMKKIIKHPTNVLE